MLKLTTREKQVHTKGLQMSRIYHGIERDLIAHLGEVERTKLLIKLNRPNLFIYLTQELRFSEAVAQAALTVYRKSKEVPAIGKAVQDRVISLSRASRVVSIITRNNAQEIISFAKTHTKAEVDREVARINPKAARKDRIRPITDELFDSRFTFTNEMLENLKRLQDIMAQYGVIATSSEVVAEALRLALFYKDPVQKAARAEARKAKKQEAPARDAAQNVHAVGSEQVKPAKPIKVSLRESLSASRKHEVMRRDTGQCTHVDLQGNRCCERRYLDIHHIRPVSQGGGNDLENLTTLCGFHHDMAHQLTFPIDGQVTWFR